MPLPKRVVEPVHVSRGTIPEDFPLPSELEAVTNGTLANTVRQLSSLSRHAEDMFGELAREAHGLVARANSLQARIDRLAVKVTQLDSNVEEVPSRRNIGLDKVSLQDIHMRKAFKSAVVFDQQVVSRDTMPTAMLEMYQMCDKPPPLDKLNCYREDGKDGLKFYTDPNYFFDLWRQEMIKDTERVMIDRGKKPHRTRTEGGGGRHKKRVRQPQNTREHQRQLAVRHGEYIMPQNIHYRTPQNMVAVDDGMVPVGMVQTDQRPPRPNSIELRRSYPEDGVPGSGQCPCVVPVGGGGGSTAIYSPRHVAPLSPTDSSHYRAAGYDDSLYQAQQLQLHQQQIYAAAQGITVVDGYPTPNNLTPSRGSAGRITSQRPSQPPPAPPSNNSSNSTPTVSSTNGTPTRSRSMSTGRETLPPPPPPPVETMNGPLPHHLRQSREASPAHSTTPSQTPEPLPADLPPPPPTPEQPPQAAPSPPPPHGSPPSSIPPPPPPPPPPPTVPNGPVAAAPEPPASPYLVNGDIGKSPIKQIISTSPPKPVVENTASRPKAAVAPGLAFNPRSDLLQAIREGITLRHVKKIEQKEVDRACVPHDVASILARRLAVEFSDSDSASESEYDSEGWGEQETSA